MWDACVKNSAAYLSLSSFVSFVSTSKLTLEYVRGWLGVLEHVFFLRTSLVIRQTSHFIAQAYKLLTGF